MKSVSFPDAGFYPFWFWNGVQDEGNIAFQLREIASSGCRGAVIHCRKGNRVKYMSDRWLALVKYACCEAEKLDLKIWLYDEDGFPSGNAGNTIQAMRPDLRQKSLRCSVGVSDSRNPVYAAYTLDFSEIIDERNIPDGTPCQKVEINYISKHVDTLHPDTVKLFVELTHEKYKRTCGEFFGKVIQAVYTDDESFQIYSEKSPVYSEELERELEKVSGMPFRKIIRCFYAEFPDAEKLRKLYYDTAQRLFLKNFIQPQKDWCEYNGLIYLGHLCGDEGPRIRAVKNYNSAGLYHEMLDVPSVDDYLLDMKDLGYLRRPYTGNELRIYPCDLERCYPLYAYKLASSVANMKGKALVSCENWTFLGWDVPVSFLEPQTLFEIANLQTLLTPHAFYYTLEGEAEHDCPPSYFIQQPCWNIFKKVVPVWSRIAEKMSRSSGSADILFIVPDCFSGVLDSASFADNGDSLIAKYDLIIQNMLLELTRKHVDFDLIEENQLVSAKREKNVLVCGKMRYHRVICVPDIPLSLKTEELVRGMKSSADTEESCWPAVEKYQELFVVRRMDEKGNKFFYFQNLSGKDMLLDGAFPEEEEYWVYDMLRNENIFFGSCFPEKFILRHGDALLLLKESDAPEREYRRSRYNCGERVSEELVSSTLPFGNLSDIHSAMPETVTYRVSFCGKADIFKAELLNGVASVRINDSEEMVLWGTGDIGIYHLCHDGNNTAEIVFSNTCSVEYGSVDDYGVIGAKIERFV